MCKCDCLSKVDLENAINPINSHINGNVVCKPFFQLCFLRVSSSKGDGVLKTRNRSKDIRGIGGGKNKISDELLQETNPLFKRI